MSGAGDGSERPDEDPFERLLRDAVEARSAEDHTRGDGAEGATGGSSLSAARAGRSRRLLAGIALGVLVVGGLGLGGVGAMLSGAELHPAPAEAVAADPPSADSKALDDAPADAETDARASAATPRPARTSDTRWVSRVSAESGIPEPALRAYANAALTLAVEQPGCGLGWNTLAAIGHVESGHGSINGSVLGADGRVTPRIVGVPLDGVQFLAVPDTDGGALDGDAVWDRAVGPMQFLPSTWAEFGRDGNGDGRAEIDQIDDAALAAASLLCSSGGDLREPNAWIAAVDGYNPSVAYNHSVVDDADFYAQFG